MGVINEATHKCFARLRTERFGSCLTRS